MTSLPAVPLTPAAAADHLHQPLLVMARPDTVRIPVGMAMMPKPRSITTEASSRPNSVWGTTSP